MFLLHTCCAPCALPLIDSLLRERKPQDFCLFFSNSNIFPDEEYQRRFQAVQTLASYYQLTLVEDQREHQEWLTYLKQNLAKPPTNYQENQERCLRCFEFRLQRTVQFAQANHFQEFATSLSINLYKDTNFINNYSQNLAQQFGLKYYQFSLTPQLAHQKERVLNQKLHLYHQKYCGCEFSYKN